MRVDLRNGRGFGVETVELFFRPPFFNCILTRLAGGSSTGSVRVDDSGDLARFAGCTSTVVTTVDDKK